MDRSVDIQNVGKGLGNSASRSSAVLCGSFAETCAIKLVLLESKYDKMAQQLSEAEAQAFYAVHKERPFYNDLVAFMTSGPVVLQVLEGENAIAKNREVMGATNPADAAEGTIRKDFAESIEANSVHGSDAPETAANEIAFFFSACEIVG